MSASVLWFRITGIHTNKLHTQTCTYILYGRRKGAGQVMQHLLSHCDSMPFFANVSSGYTALRSRHEAGA